MHDIHNGVHVSQLPKDGGKNGSVCRTGVERNMARVCTASHIITQIAVPTTCLAASRLPSVLSYLDMILSWDLDTRACGDTDTSTTRSVTPRHICLKLHRQDVFFGLLRSIT